MVAVILTGMGNDGVDGLKTAKAAGATVLAQDEASSVVYGMPGEAVAAGVVDAVVSVGELGSRLTHLVAGGTP
jgi:two-component system chemotaxis response regulator CheB